MQADSILLVCQFCSQISSQCVFRNRHQFKLDKWTNEGPTINAAFASNTREDVSELHLIVSAMIRKNLSAFISEHARNHSRAGEDSSGHYSTTDYSVGSNAQPSGGK